MTNAQSSTSRALNLAATPYQQSGARVDILAAESQADYEETCAALWNADPSVSDADKFRDSDDLAATILWADDEPFGDYTDDVWDEDAYLTAEMPHFWDAE